MQEQKLPALESGHVSDQKLPRQEHVGVADAPGPADFPKYVKHPGRGLILVNTPEREQELLAEIDALPSAPPPSEMELEILALESAMGRPFTDTEKAFLHEIGKVVTVEVDEDDDEDDTADPTIVPDPPAVPVGTEPVGETEPAFEAPVEVPAQE